ncbi:hypothetical protein F4801DRAFT_532341 [Xylaria longipes]|nr:hypothetical protein F4801DRAFT_532341 [Xylaria longipes]
MSFGGALDDINPYVVLWLCGRTTCSLNSRFWFRRILASMLDTHSKAIASQDAFGRPLGDLEVFFKSLSDSGKPLNREHWTIHFGLRLSFSPSVPDPVPGPHLRRAWQILRFRYPILGAILREHELGSDFNRASWSAGPLELEKMG